MELINLVNFEIVMKGKKNQKKVFIIAEAGVNHNGDLKLVKKMIDIVKDSGADCIKFQTFKANEFVADPNLTYTYKSQGEEVTETQLEMFKKWEFSRKQWKEIIDYCNKKGVIFATTAQNYSDLEMILSLIRPPFLKVGSDDLTNLGLLKQYAQKGIPMVISAGMAYEQEIGDAVVVIKKAGNKNITVLHCVSSYPAKAEEVNLRKIPAIRDKFDVKVGFSDHTIGSVAAVGAVCFGAVTIEKHFTLSHNLPGPDHWFSMEPEELRKFVRDIRFAEKAMGSSELVPTANERKVSKIARRSIVAAGDIISGAKFTAVNLECKRPGTGLPPKYLPEIIGKTAKRNFKKGQLLTKKDF